MNSIFIQILLFFPIVFMLYHHAFADESCGSANEGGTASITCSSGVITSIDFASYGTPTGICGAYSVSGCNAVTSRNVVYRACINRASCSVDANNVVFGDPCPYTRKRLYIQVTCTTAILPSIYPSQSPTTLSPTRIPTTLSPTLIPTYSLSPTTLSPTLIPSYSFSPTLILTSLSPTLIPTSLSPTLIPSYSLSPTVTLTSISTPVFWLTKAGLTIIIVLAVVVVVTALAILLLCYFVLVRRPDYSPTFASYASVYVDTE